MSKTTFPSTYAAWHVVHVIGIGDDGRESLARRELEIVDRADLLCGGERHLAFFPEHGAERLVIKRDVAAVCERLALEAGKRRIVVLASGDPCFFGIGSTIADRLGHERVVIHPQPSSVALAFARLGLSWHDAAVLSAHGRPLEAIIAPALAATRFAVLTDPNNTPAAVARALLDGGMEDARAWVLEHLGGPRERVVESTLTGLLEQEFARLNLVVVDRDPTRAVAPVPAFGLHEDRYTSERGQITKAEVRAVALSKAEPWRTRVAWDVGAGSGSLAIELAGLMPAGAVYAVERDTAQLAALRNNLARFPRPNLHVVAGSAPDALADLPAPDAVFVGGAGGELAAILDAAAAALASGGRLVANFAQLDSLAVWQQFARRLGWPHELLQLSVARGAPIAGGIRLAALNPVFITRLDRSSASENVP